MIILTDNVASERGKYGRRPSTENMEASEEGVPGAVCLGPRVTNVQRERLVAFHEAHPQLVLPAEDIRPRDTTREEDSMGIHKRRAESGWPSLQRLPCVAVIQGDFRKQAKKRGAAIRSPTRATGGWSCNKHNADATAGKDRGSAATSRLRSRSAELRPRK